MQNYVRLFLIIPASLVFVMLVIQVSGCKSSIQPKEIALVEKQHKTLLNSRIFEYAADEYGSYVIALEKARRMNEKENSRISWLRNYTQIQKEFITIYKLGEDVIQKGNDVKRNIADRIRSDVVSLEQRISMLKDLTLKTEKGKIARKNLVKAELALYRAIGLFNKGEYSLSWDQMKTANSRTELAEKTINNALNRYNNPDQIQKWKNDVDNTIVKSEISGGYSIIISKIEGSLSLYKDGKLYKIFQVSIGRNGLQDKEFAGDLATPEGEYQIVQKISSSRYFKALVINYPNSDDVKWFNFKKKRGLLSKSAKIGNLIEIHGGGKNILTDGCIGLDNQDIDELYNLVNIGHHVTIVGSASNENTLLQKLNTFE